MRLCRVLQNPQCGSLGTPCCRLIGFSFSSTMHNAKSNLHSVWQHECICIEVRKGLVQFEEKRTVTCEIQTTNHLLKQLQGNRYVQQANRSSVGSGCARAWKYFSVSRRDNMGSFSNWCEQADIARERERERGRERERERETDRQTDRQWEREREWERERDVGGEREGGETQKRR